MSSTHQFLIEPTFDVMQYIHLGGVGILHIFMVYTANYVMGVYILKLDLGYLTGELARVRTAEAFCPLSRQVFGGKLQVNPNYVCKSSNFILATALS